MSTDPEALYHRLVDADVLAERGDAVELTEDFAATRRIFESTYGNADDATFHQVLAELFDLDPETAAERADEHGISREELVVLLSLRSDVESATPAELLSMVGMVLEAAPASPVPSGIPEPDDPAAFLAAEPDAVVLVVTSGCDPCEALTNEIDDIRAALPEKIALACVDGDAVLAFRDAHMVTTAPTALFFRDGELTERFEGYHGPERFLETAANVY